MFRHRFYFQVPMEMKPVRPPRQETIQQEISLWNADKERYREILQEHCHMLFDEIKRFFPDASLIEEAIGFVPDTQSLLVETEHKIIVPETLREWFTSWNVNTNMLEEKKTAEN